MNGVIPAVIWCNTTTNGYTEVFIRIEKNGVIPPVVSTIFTFSGNPRLKATESLGMFQ